MKLFFDERFGHVPKPVQRKKMKLRFIEVPGDEGWDHTHEERS